MANSTNSNIKRKGNLGLIIGICTTIVAVIIIIIAVILAINNNQLSDAYFVSDDTKYVLTSDRSNLENNDDVIKVHEVYTYSGDTITSLKAYHQFENADIAKLALEKYKNDETISEMITDIEQNGNYVILTYDKSIYDGLTATDIKQQIEFLNSLKESNSTTDYTEDEIENTEVIENTTEEAQEEENTTETETIEATE